MKQYIVVVLLALILIPSSFAYTQEFNIYIPSTTAGYSGIVSDLYFRDVDTSITASKVVVVRPLYIENGHSSHPSGTLSGLGIYEGFGASSGSLVGNGSMEWTCGSNYLNYDNMCTFTYYIDDLKPTLTGTQTLRFGTTSASVAATQLYICSDYYGCFAKVNTSFSTSNDWAIYSRSGTAAMNGTYTAYSGTAIPPGPPTAGYTCNTKIPPYEYPGFNLVCTDNSTAEPAVTSRTWKLTQPDTSEYTTTNASLAKTLYPTGWYGLQFTACNIWGCGYANTTQIINITESLPQTSGVNITATTYDAQKSAKVEPSNINIQNTTTGTWSNWTATGGMMTLRSTDVGGLEKLSIGQSVKLCGYATGYAQTCGNLTIPYNGYEYTINLIGTDALPTAGNSTLIVKVIDGRYFTPLPGATVMITNVSAPYSSSKRVDGAGIATFSNIPAVAAYQVVASNPGYVSSTKYWPVASGQVTNMFISILPIGATPVPTTGPNGDPAYNPTPTQTDEHGNPIIPGVTTVDTRTAEEKDADMMGMLRDDGPTLIQFFIVCFVIYMIMGIGGKR